ncbi:phenylacetic acid degradation operon negative regulatory protein PaaX [Pseudoduganella aquatica]|uniref:Phenylacetic acid degradation operon negative regulatory protein PaaX n=1 Tax=Pseudoduganella aquatica TaxID=2660641 RepID=A0A7X4KNT4_9BURK|nr:phenylacetic acid degradation operon negative regulatory protein PaaX [Pseudoduganella aquatica]MYN08486.1 phenylacetic acid degradation operon negative regulatory protein PaaX [Pseudoduganella aquatica]
MKTLNSNEWIAHFLASDPPRSKSLVMTIFGDAIVPHGGTVWLGSLIELLAPFGVNDRLLRTAVFRLAQEGWLVSQRDGRRSSYSIAPEAQARFARAQRRIYAPLQVHWDGDWTLVMSGNSLGAAERTLLRKELVWEGYGLVSAGVFGHPAGNPDTLDELLARTGMRDKLFICHAAEMPGARNGRPLREMIDEGWDLSGVSGGYLQFIAQFEPLLALLRGGHQPEPEQAFVIRSLLIHAWRRVQLHDPQLPVELLPEPWPGASAYELARELYRLVAAAAEQHVLAVLRREDDSAAAAGGDFRQRFGGLD